MRTLDGFHYTHVVRPEFLVHLQEPITLEELEGGYTQRPLNMLWGEPYNALVKALEEFCRVCRPVSVGGASLACSCGEAHR